MEIKFTQIVDVNTAALASALISNPTQLGQLLAAIGPELFDQDDCEVVFDEIARGFGGRGGYKAFKRIVELAGYYETMLVRESDRRFTGQAARGK